MSCATIPPLAFAANYAFDSGKAPGADPLRVASYPGLHTRNAYIALFYRALHACGIEFGGEIQLTRDWLHGAGRTFHVLHFHWGIEGLWRRYLPGWIAPLARVHPGAGLVAHTRRYWNGEGVHHFAAFLDAARAQGQRLVWTCHDIEPFENVEDSDRHGYALLARSCDLIICHSEAAKAECHDRYRPGCEIVVMPIGNYDGVFPPARPRALVRHELGLDMERPLLSCLGYLREYKGLDIACEAIAQLGGGIQILFAGTPKRIDTGALRALVARLPSARLLARPLSDQEYADFVTASDAVLLPYRRITGSASLAASLTLGRGVIASDLPYFREMLRGNPDAGMLFARGDAQSLALTIKNYLRIPTPVREKAARDLAESITWDQVTTPVAHALNRWCGTARPTG